MNSSYLCRLHFVNNDNSVYCRHKLLKSATARQSMDGLNNVNYTVVDYKELPLYTCIVVNVNIPDATSYLRTLGYRGEFISAKSNSFAMSRKRDKHFSINKMRH